MARKKDDANLTTPDAAGADAVSNKTVDAKVADADTVSNEAVDAKVADTGEPEVPEPTERVKFSKGMRFPVEVTIPMSVLVAIGGTERTITIESNDHDLHPAVVEWMQSDHRWKKMFA